jgi:PAS domain S-box-containing protein
MIQDPLMGTEGSDLRSESVSDPRRLATLQQTGLLDSPAEEAFDRLTRLASRILKVPLALISLVDGERQFFKSQIGLPEPWASQRQTPLAYSFCRHVVNSHAPLVVADASQNSLVRDNPAVTELGVTAYAGIPLTTSDGQTLGSFCAIDGQPREWSEDELAILKDLTASAVTEIELRTAVRLAQFQAKAGEWERKEKSQLLEALGQPVYCIDTLGRCTFVNRVAAQALGYEPEELLGSVMHDLIHSRRADGTKYPAEDCPVLRTLQSMERHRGQNELYWRRDGSSFPVDYTASPLRSETGAAGVVISFSDVSLHKQTLQRLGVQHAVGGVLAKITDFDVATPELLGAIGTALDWQVGAVWLLDPVAAVLRCTAFWSQPQLAFPQFEAESRTLALSKGEGLAGKVWEQGTPIWSADVVSEENFFRRRFALEEGLHGVMAFPIRGGQFIGVIEFFSVVMHPPDDELIRTVSTLGHQIGQFIDRKQAEAAMRQSEARKAAVFQASLDSIISIDQQGRIIDWNQAAERVFGRTKEDVLGHEMAELIVPPAMRDKHRKGMSRYLKTGEGPLLDRRVEVTAMRADGTEFPVELAITPIQLSQGSMFTAYLRDITERKRSEQLLLQRTRLATYTAEVGIALTAENDLRAILQRCAELTVKHLDGAFARIWTVNEGESVLNIQASAGLYTHLNGTHAHVPIGQLKIGLIAQERRPHLTNSVLTDPRVGDKEWAAREKMVSFAGYPLIVDDRLMGVLAMFGHSSLGEETLQALESVAHGIALVIQRKRVEDALIKAMETAAVANEAKSLFLANMSHELRTPLTRLYPNSEVLRTRRTLSKSLSGS